MKCSALCRSLENAFEHAYWQPSRAESASPSHGATQPESESHPEADASPGNAEIDDAEFARRMQEDEHRQHLLQMAGIGEHALS